MNVIIGAIAGGIWGVISAILCIVAGLSASTGSTSIAFQILTLPATIALFLINYLDMDISGELILFSIVVIGILIGVLSSFIYEKRK